MAVPSRMVNGRDAAMRNCVVVELRRGRRPALHQDSYWPGSPSSVTIKSKIPRLSPRDPLPS